MKRYIATITAYVWAESDQEAIKKGMDLAEELKEIEDNYASLEELHQNDFGTTKKRKVQIKI